MRVSGLPVGDPVQSVLTLVEAEQAYRMNAAGLSAADNMLGTLLDGIAPRG